MQRLEDLRSRLESVMVELEELEGAEREAQSTLEDVLNGLEQVERG
jgi:hypothetical protein